jgi:hypothetical protein
MPPASSLSGTHSARCIAGSPTLSNWGRSVARFADRFGLSGDLRRVPRETFQNLWRGGRDGFGASQFHGRCDGHANTLTVLLDTKGNIFGGFTPVTDESQKSFLFTLTNPQNVGAR